MKKQALVVGSGFGGIASALSLRKLGFQVTILEKLDQIGGRARVFKKSGYTFDAGPTVITAPFLFDELFSLFKKDRKKYVKFVRLDPWYRFYFSSNEKVFDYSDSLKKTESEIQKFSHRDVEGYRKLLKFSEKIFNIGFLKLSFTPFHNFWFMIKQLPILLTLKSYLFTANFAINNADYEVAPYLALNKIGDAKLKILEAIEQKLSPQIRKSKYGKRFIEFLEIKKSRDTTSTKN